MKFLLLQGAATGGPITVNTAQVTYMHDIAGNETPSTRIYFDKDNSVVVVGSVHELTLKFAA